MICPHCNAELKDDAIFCPFCGSDKNTGWKENAQFAPEELPDYDELVENEFGNDPKSPYAHKKKGFGGIAGIIIAIVVALAFIATCI